ncbi:BcII family subclass B1 metallo-beta-lactamase [Spirosoma daeguense]
MIRKLLVALFILTTSTCLLAQTARPKPVYTPLSKDVYVHTTYGIYQNTPYPSNGLIIKTNDGVVLVDSGWDEDSSTENTRHILQWVADNLHQPVKFCIVTHAHDDRVGGIRALQKVGVRVISTKKTAQNTVKRGYPSPEAILSNDTTFIIGNEPVRCYYPGAGHTDDNIVVWLPNQRILHGGCLVKSIGVFGMGNLADANVKAWPQSMRNVLNQFGTARVVVPGHEEWSDVKALEHTLKLVEKHNAAKK